MRIKLTWKKCFLIGLGAALALAPTLTALAGNSDGGSFP